MDEPKSINLLQMSTPLSSSKITNMRQYPLPAAAHLGAEKVISDLEKRVLSLTHISPTILLSGQ